MFYGKVHTKSTSSNFEFLRLVKNTCKHWQQKVVEINLQQIQMSCIVEVSILYVKIKLQRTKNPRIETIKTCGGDIRLGREISRSMLARVSALNLLRPAMSIAFDKRKV